MSVIEHLEALRRMLIIILVAWGITTVAGFVVSGQVVEWLVSRAGLGHAVYLGPGSFVLTRLQVAIYIGLIVAAPAVIQQICCMRCPCTSECSTHSLHRTSLTSRTWRSWSDSSS